MGDREEEIMCFSFTGALPLVQPLPELLPCHAAKTANFSNSGETVALPLSPFPLSFGFWQEA